MDLPGIRVKIPGPLLSKLLHERYRSSSNCGGLLYGEIVSGSKSEITDSQHVTKYEDFVCIQDYLPVTSRNFLSNQRQSSRTQAWGEEMKYSLNSCIGIYKIRNSAANLSLLEKSMHQRLCKELHKDGAAKSSECTLALLITSETNLDATCLGWKITAFVQQNLLFSKVKLEISNLQGSVCDLYVTNPNPIGKMSSPKKDSILQSFQSSLTQNTGGIKVVEASRKVTSDLISELDDIFTHLEVSENTLKKVLEEKSALIEEWNELSAKRESRRLEESEKEYQAEKRRSLEDIKRRSPVVLLEKLDMSNAEPPSSLQGKKPKCPVENSSCSLDLSAKLSTSARAGLKKEIPEHINNTMNEGVPNENDVTFRKE